MKKRIALVMLLLAGSASAVDIETTLGVSNFQYAHDGSTWYQDPFPHTLRMVSPSFSLGVTDKIGPVRLHAGWQYLGHVSSDAVAATGADFDYSCPLAHWHGQGDVRGFYGSGEYEWDLGGYIVGAGLGILVYKPSWQVNIPDFTYCGATPRQNLTVTHNPKWQNTPTLSLSVGKGRNAATLTYLHHVTAEGDQWPALYDVNRKSPLGKAGVYGMWNLGFSHRW